MFCRIMFSKQRHSLLSTITTAETRSQPIFPNIPEEVILQILERLPLDSLSRFKCVSKTWLSLISESDFRSPTILLVSESKAYSFSLHSIDQHTQEVQLKSVNVPWDPVEEPWCRRFKILGSCNGLLLICIDEDLFMWNPLTGFFKKILAYFRLNDQDYEVCAGLCYDSAHDEYKAVLVLSHLTPDYGGEFVVVGSFKSKTWTRIDTPYVVTSMESGPIVNGNLHWFASYKMDSGRRFLSPHLILYFNAHMDKFEEVPMPEPRGEDGDIIRSLSVLDGCLCMSRLVCPGDSQSDVEVLMMKEYGVKTSWTILFTGSNGSVFNVNDRFMPLCYTKNGEVVNSIFRGNDRDWHLRAFNLTDNSHRRISIPEINHSLCVIPRKESLDTPAGYDWEEEERDWEAIYCVIPHEESLNTPAADYGWEEEEQKGEAMYMECYGVGNSIRKMKKGKDRRWTTEWIDSSGKTTCTY